MGVSESPCNLENAIEIRAGEESRQHNDEENSGEKKNCRRLSAAQEGMGKNMPFRGKHQKKIFKKRREEETLDIETLNRNNKKVLSSP